MYGFGGAISELEGRSTTRSVWGLNRNEYLEQQPHSPRQGHGLHFMDVGRGDPVVLLHGGGPGASGASNYGNIDALSNRYRLVIPDLPGGQSDRLDQRRATRGHANAMLGLLDGLGSNALTLSATR